MAITNEELRQLTAEELTAKLREGKEELFNLRFQAATGQLECNRFLHSKWQCGHDLKWYYQ